MAQRLARCAIALLLLVFSASLAEAQRRTERVHGREVAEREVLVKLRVPTPRAMVEIEMDEDADEIEEVVGRGIIRLRSRTKGAAALVASLAGRADVEYVEPNYIVRTRVVPQDPGFGSLWGLENTGQVVGGAGRPGADIEAPSAWDVSTGSRAHVVAVVDTGVDYTHPDLAANMWSAPEAFTVAVGGRTITCAAGTHGFNAITNTCDPRDDNDHGSHVAGTIGAVGNNGLGVTGVNWQTSIMALKFLDASGRGTVAGAINAIEFAIQAKAAFAGSGGANVRVLNNSWGGGGFSQALLDQINRAHAHGILFVAAAGNDGANNDATPNYPSNYTAPNVVAVAATDNTDGLAWFSNFGGTSVDLGAPGLDILSTIRAGSYAYFSGTSMATSHVAGAATLILSKCELDTAGLKMSMLNTGDPVPSLAGITVTGGRLNVNRAIRACMAAAPLPDFTIAAAPASRTVGQGAATSYVVTVGAVGGFTGTVALEVISGLPAGAGASFNPSALSSGDSTLTVTTGATTPPGSYSLRIRGTSDGSIREATVTLVVQQRTFSLSVSPTSRSVRQGNSTTYTVTITPAGGFTGVVRFSVGVPPNATVTFSPTSVTTSGTTTMRVTTRRTTPATPRGTYRLTITASADGLIQQRTVTLVVRAP